MPLRANLVRGRSRSGRGLGVPLHRLSDADRLCLSRVGACSKRNVSHALRPAEEVHQDGRERDQACPLVLQRLRNAGLCLRIARSTHLLFACRLLGATQSTPTAETNLVPLIVALVRESEPDPESRPPMNSVCFRQQVLRVGYRKLAPNPSIERTASGLRPPAAAHVKR